MPYDSPINRSGILFYNTLFDENASCHLALGMGYSSCLKDFEKYTPEEAREDIEIALAAIERRYPVMGKRNSPNMTTVLGGK